MAVTGGLLRRGAGRGALGVGWPSSLGPSSVVHTVQLDGAADPKLPQPLHGLLAQAGGPQALPIECQLQPSLVAQEQHLAKEGMRPAGFLIDPLLCPMPHPASPFSPRTGPMGHPALQQHRTGAQLVSGPPTRICSALGLSFTICNKGCFPWRRGSQPWLHAGISRGFLVMLVPGPAPTG